MAKSLTSVIYKQNPKFIPQLMSITNDAIKNMARELRDNIRKKISIPFPPASLPGQPPHKRTGGLRRAIFAKKIAQADWAIGVMQVPGRKHVGIWLELGTGSYRQPYPKGTTGFIGFPRVARWQSVKPRPYLMNTFLQEGPWILRYHLGKVGKIGGRVGV